MGTLPPITGNPCSICEYELELEKLREAITQALMAMYKGQWLKASYVLGKCVHHKEEVH